MIKTFSLKKEITIQIDIESYNPYHHSCDRMSPDDPEEIEIFAWMIIKKGDKNYKIMLHDYQIEALNLEQIALDEIHQDKLEMRIDHALERDVPELLVNRVDKVRSIGSIEQIKEFVRDLQKIQGGRT